MHPTNLETRLAERQWLLDRLEEELTAIAEGATSEGKSRHGLINNFRCRSRHSCRRLMGDILRVSRRLMPQIRVIRAELDQLDYQRPRS